MPIAVAVQEVPAVWEQPVSTPLDETAWQAWVAKGYAQDQRDSAVGLGAVKWVSIGVLLASAGLWPDLAPYGVVIRFIVSAAAIVLMVHAFRAGHEAFAAVFGALALVYNPVAPLFSIAGGWQQALMVASAAPFVASLAWRRARAAQR